MLIERRAAGCEALATTAPPPSGFVLAARIGKIERWSIRRVRESNGLVATYDAPHNSGVIELALRPLASGETLAQTLDRARTPYRGPGSPWSEREIAASERIVAGVRRAVLQTTTHALNRIPGRRILVASHAAGFALTADATYADAKRMAVESALFALLESLAPAASSP